MAKSVWVLLSDYADSEFSSNESLVVVYSTKRKAQKAMQRYVKRKEEMFKSDEKTITQKHIGKFKSCIVAGDSDYEAYYFAIHKRHIK